MRWSFRRSSILGLTLALLHTVPAFADVKTREKGQVKFEGALGTAARMFGGKAASEGIVSSNALKGSRKATFTDTTGRIVDLGEEKVYDIDMRKKEYRVTTFEELRRQLREAQERAAKEAAKEAPKEGQPPPSGDKPAEVEFDLDVKETGQTRQLVGHDARQVIITLTVREKGKTLDESGGLVVTADSWLGPDIPALQEMAEFEVKYWKAIAPETATISAEQMATIAAIYPMVKPAMDRLGQERRALKGTALATTMTFEGVKSKAQVEADSKSSSGSGLSGMLARRVMKKNDSPRAVIMTIISETLEIAPTVAATDVEVPAGFKLKN
jgi:hypothetical protein